MSDNQRKVQQFDPTTQTLLAEFATPVEAANSIGKPNGVANILICSSNNYLLNKLVRKAYGFCWQLSS